jgi:hypothetical protein
MDPRQFRILHALDGRTGHMCKLHTRCGPRPYPQCIGVVQGLGKMPAGVLTGTLDGRLCLVKRQGKSQSIPYLLDDHPYNYMPIWCFAAADQVVVTGSSDGAMRIIRMDCD